MSFPNFQNKQKFASVLTASGLLAHRRVNPKSIVGNATAAVVCLQKTTALFLVKKFNGKSFEGFSGQVYRLEKLDPNILAAIPGGVGAPSLAVTVEELASCGIRKLIAVGIAGTIGEEIAAGEIILPSGAIRDEGTSYHYLMGDLAAKPSENLLQKFTAVIQSRSLKYTLGRVWTTDAPFRETAEEIREYRHQGVLAVEMECAALFSVCSALDLECACGLIASDSLSGGIWRPSEDSTVVDRSLKLLSEVAIRALGS